MGTVYQTSVRSQYVNRPKRQKRAWKPPHPTPTPFSQSLLPSRTSDAVAIAIHDIPPAAQLHHRLAFDLTRGVVAGVVVKRVTVVDHLFSPTRARRRRHRPLYQALPGDWRVGNHERRPSRRARAVATRAEAGMPTEHVDTPARPPAQ